MEKTFLESIIPFITNMRKGVSEDTPAPGPKYTLEAFVVGDSLGDGALVHIDKSKESELVNYISNLPYNAASAPMIIMLHSNYYDVLLVALDLHMNDETLPEGSYGLMLTDGQYGGFIYSTVEGTFHAQTGNVDLKVGFQENGVIDENDNIELKYGSSMLDENGINPEMNPELWNGVFIGKAVLID